MKKILVRNYDVKPGNDILSTLKLEKALEECRNTGENDTEECTLVFEEGEYHFYPEYAKEILMFIPNHDDDTIKRVVFDLSTIKHLRIQGNHTAFIFHTDVLPFYLYQSEDIEMKGISIDYDRPAYSEGTITEVTPQRMCFSIDKEKYPYDIRDGRIYFKGDNFCHELNCGCLELDGQRKSPVYGGHDISFNNSATDYSAVWKETQNGCVEAVLQENGQAFLKTSKVGNKMIFRHHPRNYPGIYIKESKNIRLYQVDIYHCEAMGVIAEFSENITLEEFRVTFSPKNPRVFTACADATHFVYCKGLILIKDCLFENQLDDPVNIHGIYQRIHKIIHKRKCILQLLEHQQRGVKIGDVGDRLSVIHNETMLREGNVTIKSIKRINKDYCYIETEEDFPDTVKEMFVVENIEYVPDVLIEGCTFQNNRARGLLLTSAGDVVVRKNIFRTAGAAILIEGDCNYWFESGAVNHIRIQDNLFENCDYIMDWGKAPIQISPSAIAYVEGKRYHKFIEICNNRFICFDSRLLFARNVEKIIWKGNVVTDSDTYPPIEGKAFVLEEVLEFEDS